MKIKKIEGLIAPVYTPLKHDGSLALERIADYAEYINEKDLGGVFIAGSSGEGMLLSTSERKAVMEEWAPFDSEEFKLIVHVGHTSYKESQELAVHARENNAYAVSVMGPLFQPPKTAAALVEYCALIAAAVPDTPFYYYHIPLRTGVDVGMADFLRLGSQRIPNLAGIKFTHSNFLEMQQCMMVEDGRFDILQGMDVTLVCGLLFGIKGAIGTTYNFASDLYKKLITAFEQRNFDELNQLQKQVVRLSEILARYGGGIVAGKAILKICGVDCGPCRSPLEQLSGDRIGQLEKDLAEIGFFDF